VSFERHGVRYVLIDVAAARIAGAPIVTEDIAIAPATSPENLERLAAALPELGARLRPSAEPDGVTFPIDVELLTTAELWTLTTSAGDLDVCFKPAGTRGFDDLRREASRERLDRGLTVTVASLRDVIRSKEAAGRDKDLAQLPLLRRTLEQIREHEIDERRSV